MRASWSEKSVDPFTTIFPVMFTLPGIVTTPDESIVSLANPPVTNDIWSRPGLITPVSGSPANFRAQLDSDPIEKLQLLPSSFNNGKPPTCVAS